MDILKGVDKTKVSSMRVAAMMTVVTVLAVYVIQNVLSILKGTGAVYIGTGEVTLIIGVLAAKAGQSFSEHKASNHPTVTVADMSIGSSASSNGTK